MCKPSAILIIAAMALVPSLATAQENACPGLKALTQSAAGYFSDMTGAMFHESARRTMHRVTRPTWPLEGRCEVWKPKSPSNRHTLICEADRYVDATTRYVQTQDSKDAFSKRADAYIAFISNCLGTAPKTETVEHPRGADMERRSWRWQGPGKPTWHLVLDVDQARVGKPVADAPSRPKVTTFLYSPPMGGSTESGR